MYFLPYDISKFSILSKRHLKYHRSMKMPSDSHQQQPYGVILCPIYGIGFSIVNWRRITCSNSWRLNFTVSLSSIRNTTIAVYTCYLVHILSKYICKLQSHQQRYIYIPWLPSPIKAGRICTNPNLTVLYFWVAPHHCCFYCDIALFNRPTPLN